MMPTKIICSLAAGVVISLILVSATEAAPMPSDQRSQGESQCQVFVVNCQSSIAVLRHSNAFYNDLDEVPDDILMELMARFGQTIMRARNDLENSKRTVDFGLARGFSGTQEAKHRMGLAAANFPGGPGRRRRSETEA